MVKYSFTANQKCYCGPMTADGDILFSCNHHPDYSPYDISQNEDVEVGTVLYNYLVSELVENSDEVNEKLKENDMHPIHFFNVKISRNTDDVE